MNLLDSDILIDFLHRNTFAEEFLESLKAKEEILTISAITRMELMQGCRNKREMSVVLDILKKFRLIYMNGHISQKAIDLMENYNLSHGLLIPDAIIAATAITMDLELYSRNIRHFSIIEELKVSKPY